VALAVAATLAETERDGVALAVSVREGVMLAVGDKEPVTDALTVRDGVGVIDGVIDAVTLAEGRREAVSEAEGVMLGVRVTLPVWLCKTTFSEEGTDDNIDVPDGSSQSSTSASPAGDRYKESGI
jgi:hypothetical protein